MYFGWIGIGERYTYDVEGLESAVADERSDEGWDAVGCFGHGG